MPAAGREEGEDGAQEHGGARRRGRRNVAAVSMQNRVSKKSTTTLMIVETKHLFSRLGSFRETLLATSRCYDVIAVPIVQLVLHQVVCVSVSQMG